MRKLRSYIPREILITLYNSLILPYLTYALEVWHDAFLNETERVFVLQDKSIRIANALEYNAHTTSYFRSMQALNLPDLYKYHLLIFVYKSLILKENVNVVTFRQNLENHDYNTREKEAITIPLYKRVKSQFSIRYAAAKVWNGLPTNIRSCISLTMFKTALKQYIYSSYKLSY